MRNLKKFLALVLAMIMVVSATAMVSAFDDVTADNKYAAAIDDLAGKEIVKGETETTFGANNLVKRWQMALFIARSMTAKTGDVWGEGVVFFNDIKGASANYKGAIEFASVNGIITGRGNKTFDPDGNITYIEALTMAVRALGIEVDTTNINWKRAYYGAAVEAGLTANMSGNITADQALTRAETAQIIHNMLYVELADGTTFAELFGKVIEKDSDLFVITATPKQNYVDSYGSASDNNTGVYVGVQPLVNGVPNGEMTYIPAAKLGIKDADVEKYFNYSVELVNFNNGEFDAARLGAAPKVISDSNTPGTYPDYATNTITIGYYDVYYIVDSLSGNPRKNEIVAYASSDMGTLTAKLLHVVDGIVYDKEGTPVANEVEFGGNNLKYYAALVDVDLGPVGADAKDIVAGAIISEHKALEAWGFTTTDVQYTAYTTINATEINEMHAWQGDFFDDDGDGKPDRVFVTPIYMSVYKEVTESNTVYVDNVTAAGNKVEKADLTISTALKTGDVYVYTYNEQLNQINVIDVVKPQTGTLTKVNASMLNVITYGVLNYTIDGANYATYYVKDTVNNPALVNFTYGAKIGANLIFSGVVNSFADIAKGNFQPSNGFFDINTLRVGKKVNFYAYNNVVIYIEEAKPAPVATDMVVMSELVDIDNAFENFIAEFYVDGINGEQKIAKIDGKTIANLSTWQITQLFDEKELFYPGLIYQASVNADAEYSLLETLNPNGNAAHLAKFGIKRVTAASTTADGIVFKNGVSTVADYEKKILADENTIFYFIDRSANGYVDGPRTTVQTYIGMPSDASIKFGAHTIVLADKIGLTDGDFADVIVVLDAADLKGFGYTKATNDYVYVPQGKLQVTVAGTAAELGLNGAKYDENKYYYYKEAAIDLETGKKVDFIYDKLLTKVNENAIFVLDDNGVVVPHMDKFGAAIDAANADYYTLEEAVDNGILLVVEDAVVTYHPEFDAAIVSNKTGTAANTIGMDKKITSLTVFPVGAKVEDANFLYNTDVNDVITGNYDVYYLADSLADGSVTLICG